MNIIQALNHTLHQEFARNPKLITFGEDAGAFGGVFRVTSGLQKTFGEERCFDTPLTEQGIIGFGIGVAQKGLKPICEGGCAGHSARFFAERAHGKGDDPLAL